MAAQIVEAVRWQLHDERGVVIMAACINGGRDPLGIEVGDELLSFNLDAGSWPSLVGVLGSAVAEEYLLQAAVKGIPLDELAVVFTSVPGTAPSTSTGTLVTYPRGLAYTAYIVSPASDAELESLRQTVEQTSPIIDLITRHRDIVAHGELNYTQTPATREGKTLEGLREYLAEKHAAGEGAIPAEGVEPKPVKVDGEPRCAR